MLCFVNFLMKGAGESMESNRASAVVGGNALKVDKHIQMQQRVREDLDRLLSRVNGLRSRVFDASPPTEDIAAAKVCHAPLPECFEATAFAVCSAVSEAVDTLNDIESALFGE